MDRHPLPARARLRPGCPGGWRAHAGGAPRSRAGDPAARPRHARARHPRRVVLPAPEAGRMTCSEVLRADARRIPVELSMGTAGEGQELLQTVILRDISERITAENQIRSSAMRLENTNKRLEEMNAQLEEASRLK